MKRPVIGFERPERQKDSARHAIVALGPVKHRAVFLCILRAVVDAVLADQTARKLGKALAKDALSTVGLQHLRVLLRGPEKAVHLGLAKAVVPGFGLERLEEGRKTAATGRGRHRRGGKRGGNGGSQGKNG